MRNLMKASLLGSVAPFSLLFCAPVSAQDADAVPPAPAAQSDQSDANQINQDVIVVTAQRRSERLQDVGIAVTAYDGNTLRKEGVLTSTDVATFTPGVSVSGTLGGQGLQFSIRGVTQSDYNDAIEAPVAVYIDDSYVSSQQGQVMALFDIARVEALKGPQGTLFGRNATGGLVHFVVNKPELGITSGSINATYARFNRTVLEGALNLPLGDTLAARLSGIWNRSGDIWKNRFPAGVVAGAPLNFGPAGVSPSGQDLGGENSIAGRAQLLWEPSDTLSIRLTGSAFRQNLSESPWTSSSQVPVLDAQNRVVDTIYASPTETRAAIGPDGQNFFNPAILPFQGFLFSPNGDGQRAPGASWFGYVPLGTDDLELSKDYALSDLNRFRAYNTALHVGVDLGGIDLVSVTSYSKYKKHFLLDADGSPVNGFGFGTRSDTDTFSQELRFSGGSDTVDWVAGAYYLNINANVAQGLLAPRGSALAAIYGASATGIDPLSVFELKTESASLFGQVSWEFVPDWTFILGGRLIREHQEYQFDSYATANIDDYSVDLGAPLFPLQPSFTDRRTDTLWAGKAQIEYRPNSNLLLYAGVNRGVKGGSYNGKLADGTPPLADADIPYEPEELLSYEGGFKLTGSGNRYTLNGTIYHYRYKNYQSFVFADISGFVRNQKARTTGAELEATARIGQGLRLAASASYTDATVKGLQVAPGVPRDTRPTYTPKWSANGRINYTFPGDIAGGELSVGSVVTYQSSFFHNARNFQGQRYGGRTLVDFNAQWEISSGLSLGAYLKNAFDLRYRTVGLDLATGCGCSLEAYGEPRTWGVSVGYKF
tara:strand:+ start:27447 stop:29921 length:2475 start_codon:yes stop_codon:yes gene_type:complete